MKYCEKCGKEYKDGNYCGECGTLLKEKVKYDIFGEEIIENNTITLDSDYKVTKEKISIILFVSSILLIFTIPFNTALAVASLIFSIKKIKIDSKSLILRILILVLSILWNIFFFYTVIKYGINLIV